MNKKTNEKMKNKNESLTAAFFGSQEAPDGVGYFDAGDDFCLAIQGAEVQEEEWEETAAASEAYDKALNEVMAKRSRRSVYELNSMENEAWKVFYEEWGHNLSWPEKRFIEARVQKVLADFRKEHAMQPAGGEKREPAEPRKKVVKSSGRAQLPPEEKYRSSGLIEVFPGTDILADFFEKEGFAYEIEPGFDFSSVILKCCGDGWGPLDICISSTAGKDLVIFTDPLEVCPEKKRIDMLIQLDRFNSEGPFVPAYIDKEGGIRMRWNSLCREEDLIPIACEALGRVLDCIDEVMPYIWESLEN